MCMYTVYICTCVYQYGYIYIYIRSGILDCVIRGFLQVVEFLNSVCLNLLNYVALNQSSL